VGIFEPQQSGQIVCDCPVSIFYKPRVRLGGEVRTLVDPKAIKATRCTGWFLAPNLPEVHRNSNSRTCRTDTFILGVTWDINSFDQWGGPSSIVAQKILPELGDSGTSLKHQRSSSGLIEQYRKKSESQIW